MQKRRGDILPLALIMTTMVLLASIGIGQVVLEGLQGARNTDLSVGAYYMADAGVERQLYEIRKNNQPIDYINTLDTKVTSPAFPTGSTAVAWKSVEGLGVANVKVIPFVDTTSFAEVDLFDPNDLGKKATPPVPDISRVDISWSYDATKCALPSQLEASYGYWDLSSGVPQLPTDKQYVVLPKQGSPMSVPLPIPHNDYRLRLRFYNCPAANVKITAFDTSPTPKQTAFPGDVTLSAEGFYGEATQKIAVTLPKQDVLSGLFSYVIFSECTLYKGTGAVPGC